jgi:hypothetical protein
VFTGPGLYSLDAALGLGALSAPSLDTIALVLAVLGAVATLVVRRPAHATL